MLKVGIQPNLRVLNLKMTDTKLNVGFLAS